VPDVVAWLDAATADEVRTLLLTLTASPAWADQVVAGRPYGGLPALLDRSDALVATLSENEVDAALAGHPRIGERAQSLDADSAARSAREQSGMAGADDRLREAMTSGNAAYEARFGRIYLVAAAGRSAEELLALLRQRLSNDPDAELDVVRRELARITRLRLADTFGGDQA
jgi:2-oxo-4-hydroxy-4-carboxy-5-ureidoimidazoline decarboxylase